jgi:hypothetical protein
MTDDEAADADLKLIKSLNLSKEEKTRLIKIWETAEFLRRKLKRIQRKHAELYESPVYLLIC